jgi:hypothetical protein
VIEGRKDSSFLKKRSKKLLPLGARIAGSVGKVIKVFWFFFSKKNTFFLSSPGRDPANAALPRPCGQLAESRPPRRGHPGAARGGLAAAAQRNHPA